MSRARRITAISALAVTGPLLVAIVTARALEPRWTHEPGRAQSPGSPGAAVRCAAASGWRPRIELSHRLLGSPNATIRHAAVRWKECGPARPACRTPEEAAANDALLAGLAGESVWRVRLAGGDGIVVDLHIPLRGAAAAIERACAQPLAA